MHSENLIMTNEWENHLENDWFVCHECGWGGYLSDIEKDPKHRVCYCPDCDAEMEY